MKKFSKRAAVFVALLIMVQLAEAGTSDLKGVVERIQDQIRGIANLLIIVSYITGVGFTLAGILQFKAHKDNPTQIPLSKPMVYLVVGASLLFLPAIFQTAGETVFEGTDGNAASGSSGFGD